MKHLFFLTALIAIASCMSCSGSSASKAADEKDVATDKASSSSSSASGDAIFSYNLDGEKISGGEVDARAMNNAAWVTKNDAGDKLSFFLNDAYKDNTETFSHSLRFAIPDKTGTVALAPDGDNWSVQLFVATGEDGKYSLYANEAFSVTVTNVSDTRVSGTFSGKVKLAENQGAEKGELVVTDGKFDIPVRTQH